MKRGMRRGLSVLLVLVVVIARAHAVRVSPSCRSSASRSPRSPRTPPAGCRTCSATRPSSSSTTASTVIDKVQDYVTEGDFGQQVFGGALGVGLAVLSALANAFIVIVLMVYFLVSLPSIKHAAYSIAPASKRVRVSELGDRIIRSTGAYVSGAFLVSVCAGVSTLIFTFFVGPARLQLRAGLHRRPALADPGRRCRRVRASSSPCWP